MNDLTRRLRNEMRKSKLYRNIERKVEVLSRLFEIGHRSNRKMDDPAELRQTAAFRMAQVPRITNDAWILNLRCTLT